MSTPFSKQQLADAIKGIEAEIAEIDADAARRKKKLAARRDLFQEMLSELVPTAPTQPALALDADAPDIREFFSNVLADGVARDGTELVACAVGAGLLKPFPKPGRSVHGVMLGMLQNGLVKREKDKWVIATP